MKNLNPQFVIGSVGMVVTALLHMLMAFVVAQSSVHKSFFIIYPVFAAFLTVGIIQIILERRLIKLRERRK
jgi:hypothetical protein